MAAPNTTTPKVLFKGSCACSRLTYHITSLPTATNACHCLPCRKLSGGAFQAFFDIAPSSTIFFDAQHPSSPSQPLSPDAIPGLTLLRLSPHAVRGSCASCHTWLTMRYHLNAARNIALTLGSVDEESYAGDAEVREALRVKQHIFATQKAGWMGPEWLVAEAERGVVFERFPGVGFEEAMVKAAEGGGEGQERQSEGVGR